MTPRPTILTAHARTTAAMAAGLLIALSLASCSAPSGTPSTKPTASATPTASAAAYVAPTAATVAALPEAKYDSVISGLLPYYEPDVPKTATETYTLTTDAPLYGEGHTAAVARLAAKNFLGDPTVVVPVQTSGDWDLVMTPARQQLPSVTSGSAAAQTTAWIRKDLLHKSGSLHDTVVISVGKQTVSIVDRSGKVVHDFPAGVGAGGTPTPTGVIGYIQARYLDPVQDQTVHKINLTTLHSAAADEPYGGDDGGLIGVHYESVARGAVSHGCVRLNGDAVEAVNALPLGTIVQIVA